MARSKTKKNDSHPPPTFDEKIIRELLPWRMELFGLCLAFLALLLIFELIGVTMPAWVGLLNTYLRSLFGLGTFIIVIVILLGSAHLVLRRFEKPYELSFSKVLGVSVLLFTLFPLAQQITGTTRIDAILGQGGGLIGWVLSEPFKAFFGPFLTAVFYIGLLGWSVALLFEIKMEDVQNGLREFSQHLRKVGLELLPSDDLEVYDEPVLESMAVAQVDETPVVEDIPESIQLVDAPEPVQPKLKTPRRSSKLPPLRLLEEGTAVGISDAEIDEKKRIIEQTLDDFGLPAEVTRVRKGPVVTQFGVSPGYIERPGPDGDVKLAKVRVNQIAALQRDLALALAVQRLRVQAPVPGLGVVGLEVPNGAISMVRLRTIIQSTPFRKIRSPLAVALGQDVSGDPVAVDLGKLPHLLIAGTTGSGKSICMNALISCLVFNNSPEKLKLVMIDPKKVELIRFNGLPHLIGNVEVEADRAVGVLRWLTAEMDRRYEMFTQLNARNLRGFNQKVVGHKTLKKLPYMAVFIDELADLMHIYPGDVERTLCRLAQMARATGIHLIVATQRPSTDVITGLIKANFPARLSFAVASGTDSRVILDSVGAEQLLGKGDSLFLSPDASSAQRTQGVFVSDQEVEHLVNFWQETLPDWEPIPSPWESLIAKHALLDETDALLEAAIDLAQKQDFLSTSFLQRRLKVGYPRAARIMEHLFEMGLVEDPKSGGKTRRTMVTEEDEDPLDRIISEREDEE
ncbi:MAG: DNA translocase FtsK [Chloroflexota bacterium]